MEMGCRYLSQESMNKLLDSKPKLLADAAPLLLAPVR